MGPGLFLALAVLAGAARAETAVGLDARGVDPMAAVDNRQGLDVRDALGRPVSAQIVLSELKKASVARVAQIAFTSGLPKAKTILPALDMAAGAAVWLVRLAEAVPGPAAWAALPTPGPKLSLLVLVVLGAVLAQASSAFRPRALLPALSSCRRGLEVLRC
ncbi:MAG: hypothetical protein KGJ84_02430 [Elusimicrobia bacterium]|nr:hypothetical protein [Elusimicrobiota bacterium]